MRPKSLSELAIQPLVEACAKDRRRGYFANLFPVRWFGRQMRATQTRIILRVIERYQHPDLFAPSREYLHNSTAVLTAINHAEREAPSRLGFYWFRYWRYTITSFEFDKLWEEIVTTELVTPTGSRNGPCFSLTKDGYRMIRPWYRRLGSFVVDKASIEIPLVGVVGILLLLWRFIRHL